RARLHNAPDALSYPESLWDLWQSPDLYLSQTCALPFRAQLHERVTLVGTPDYGLEGCQPGYYNSVIVVRRDDPRRRFVDYRNAILAFNEPLSQSGWGALWDHAKAHGFAFTDLLQTGAHVSSARAVVAGDADLAALDAQSWRLMQRYDAWAKGLRVIEWTKPTPGLPLITARANEAPRIADAVNEAILALATGDRDTLGVKALIKIPCDAYMALPLPDFPDEKPRKDVSKA
ncbi:MAG: PhnD/SsuA/transferrin family substrate-binding protein, partial [Pseudomonadota bacterium]